MHPHIQLGYDPIKRALIRARNRSTKKARWHADNKEGVPTPHVAYRIGSLRAGLAFQHTSRTKYMEGARGAQQRADGGESGTGCDGTVNGKGPLELGTGAPWPLRLAPHRVVSSLGGLL